MSTLYDQVSIHDIDCPDWDNQGIEKCVCQSSQAIKELDKLLLENLLMRKALISLGRMMKTKEFPAEAGKLLFDICGRITK